MTWLRLLAMVAACVAFGVATATLAVLGAWSALDEEPAVGVPLGAVVALGVGGPPLVRAFSSRARLAALAVQELLRWHADSIRERIVLADVGLGLRDVGVHVFVKRRRTVVPWRHEYVRYARSAFTNRSPEPQHAMWPEDWWTGKADGLVGIAAHRNASLRVDLLDADHVNVAKETWDRWYHERDERSLGVHWERGAKARDWFSALWAEPVPSPEGAVIGVITLNVEREVSDGHARLQRAGADIVLREVARAAGYAIGEQA